MDRAYSVGARINDELGKVRKISKRLVNSEVLHIIDVQRSLSKRRRSSVVPMFENKDKRVVLLGHNNGVGIEVGDAIAGSLTADVEENSAASRVEVIRDYVVPLTPGS